MAKLVEIDSKRSHSISVRTVIGRDETCPVRIDDPMVSATHAEIVRGANGAFQIRDLGSRRGTFVGSRKIAETALAHGDEVMIGPIRMRFEDDGSRLTSPGSDHEELLRLRAVVELGHAIGVEHDLERLLDRVLETCLQLLRADRGAIVVYPPHSKTPCMTVTRTRARGEPAFAVSTSVLSQVMIGHEPYLRTEIDDDVSLRRSESLCAHGVRSVMAVPLRYQTDETEWLGVIQLDSRAHVNVFGPRDLELLSAIAGPTSLAIKNALLVRQVQSVTSDEERRLERVVRNLPVGVVVIGNERRCVLVNRWATDNAVALGVLEVGAEVVAIAGIPLDTLTGDARQHEVTTCERVLSIAATTSADGNDTVIVVNDVTAERERQNQTAHRDRVALLGQLAGGIAHDFNNLLVVILNYANLLEETLEDPNARDDAHQISHAATSAAELTKQLLTFTRRELVKTRVIDVIGIVRGMKKMLVRTLGTIELVADIRTSAANVLMDGAQLEQILMNLVVNARDAMPDGGRVSLIVESVDIKDDRASRRAIAPGRYVTIRVRDNGTGMAPDVVARIFEPYFTTKARGHGTGLGLATVYGLVQQARGDIVVESTPGQGTMFQIYLPETERVEATKRIATVANKNTTILVVDDDDSVRRLTERMLRAAGYQVLAACSGEDALEVARMHPDEIHVLLSDMVMPGMSGRDLARELVEARPATRVIFMSGYHHELPISSAQFVAKPFDRTGLLAKIEAPSHRAEAELAG